MAESAAWAAYRERVEAMRRALLALPTDAPVRLRKSRQDLEPVPHPRRRSTPRSTRTGFAGVLDDRRRGDAPPTSSAMTTYEDLVAATLPHGLIAARRPAAEDDHARRRRHRPRHRVVVVPQRLPARVGARDGRPDRRRPRSSRRRPDNEHRDLFYGFPNSYGTLGYALRLRIELEPVTPYVHLRHLRFDDVDDCAARDRQRLWRPASRTGERVDFVDGTWFSGDRVLPDAGDATRRRAPTRVATTPASRSTTARSSSAARTG